MSRKRNWGYLIREAIRVKDIDVSVDYNMKKYDIARVRTK